MNDCCLSPRPEGLTAHTARCLLESPAPVAHLRTLRDEATGRGQGETTTETDPNEGASE